MTDKSDNILLSDSVKDTVVQRAFPRIALIGYQTIVFILSFFRDGISKSNQIDSLKNAQDDPKDSNCRYKMVVLWKKMVLLAIFFCIYIRTCVFNLTRSRSKEPMRTRVPDQS